MPLTACAFCGTSFCVPSSRLAAGKGRYCSRECRAKAESLPRNAACAYCGATLQFRRRETRYCSRRCAALALHNASSAVRLCRACRAPFHSSSAREVFCSGACEAKHAAASGKIILMGDPWRSVACEAPEAEHTRRPDFYLGF